MAETYRIVIQPEASEAMDTGYEYIKQDAPDRAIQWAFGLLDAIDSLKTFPARCPLARENAFFPQEIRHFSMAMVATHIGFYSPFWVILSSFFTSGIVLRTR